MSDMNMGYSPADMAAVMGNNGGFGGNGWNSPVWLLWALLFGRGGFGFGNNAAGAVQGAEIQGQLESIRQQMADNQNANTLGAGISGNHEFMHGLLNSMNSGFANTSSAINAASTANLMSQKDASAQMASCCCDIKSNILNQTNQLQNQIAQLANGTQQGFASIGYAMAQQTNELNTNATANTQRILDHLCNAETQALRDKLAQASQNEQTAYLISQLKTTA